MPDYSIEEICEDALTHGLLLSEVGIPDKPETTRYYRESYRAYLMKKGQLQFIDQ